MTDPTQVLPRPGSGRTGRRGSLTTRIAAACLLVAIVAVAAAALVSIRLVAATARDVAADLLARQADVVAAQLDEGGAGVLGVRRVAEVLHGQGVAIVPIRPAGAGDRGDRAARAAVAQVGAERVLRGEPVSARAVVDGVVLLVEARPVRAGGLALVQEAGAVRDTEGLLRRNVTIALLVGTAAAVVVGAVVAGLLARPLRHAAAGARALRGGRRDIRIPVQGPTEIAEVAAAVNDLADALARSEARQQEFLLSVSHELRTPLTAVSGFAESLADGVVSGDSTRDAGRTIGREAHRLQRLVEDLMELARLQADDFRLDPVPVDLGAVLAEAGEVWSVRCAAAGVAFRLLGVGGPPVVVRADPRRLRQVVDGLAENALRVTPPGGPLVLALRREPDTAVVEVRDGGPGLTPEDRAVAFERGVLHERYRGRRTVGAGGVGLALVHGLVRRMGGRISVGTAPEGGARFHVTLPREPG